MKHILFAALTGLLIPAVATAATTVHNSLVEFNDALMGAPTTTFTFDDTFANNPFLDFGPFQSSVSNPDMSTQHRTFDNQYLIQVDPAPSGGGGLVIPPVDTRVTMVFDDPIYGLAFDEVGADFIDISIDGGATFFDIATATDPGFFGITSDATFDTVFFQIQPPTDVGDGMLLSNLTYTTEALPMTPVPLPAPAFLLLGGLVGLVGVRKMTKAA